MTMLSITLPDTIAKASQAAAKELGVSRTQFIRLAIIHELESFQGQREQAAIIKSMQAIKNSAAYLQESLEIMDNLNTDLPTEDDEWWNNKTS